MSIFIYLDGSLKMKELIFPEVIIFLHTDTEIYLILGFLKFLSTFRH